MVIEDEIADDVIEEVDQRKEVSNSNSRSSEPQFNHRNFMKQGGCGGGSSSNNPSGNHRPGGSCSAEQENSNAGMLEGSEEFKMRSKNNNMGLEEEKVENNYRNKESKPPNNFRLLFGVPVILEENSSQVMI